MSEVITSVPIRLKRKYTAQKGSKGQKSNYTGRSGKSGGIHKLSQDQKKKLPGQPKKVLQVTWTVPGYARRARMVIKGTHAYGHCPCA